MIAHILIALFVLLLAISIAVADTYIRTDYGGQVGDYMDRVAEADRHGERIAIVGDCRSACTLYLGADHVCVSPRAVLRFHKPNLPALATPEQEAYAVERMGRYYPPAIRGWWRDTASKGTVGTVALTGRQLIAVGVQQC